MKSSYYILLLVFTIFSITNHVGAQGKKQDIIGTWTFNDNVSFEKMEASSKSLLNGIAPEGRERIENLFKNRKATFNSDGSYLLTLSNGKTSNAKWVIDKNKLIIIYPAGDQDSHKIKTLTNSILVLKPIAKGARKPLISEWHFTKN